MPETKLQDLLIPEVVSDYAAAEIVERSAFINSGIATGDYNNVDIKSGGTFIKVPFFNELTGDPEPLSESDDFALSVDKMTADADIGVIIRRGKAWGFNDIAEIASGEDLSQEIGKLREENFLLKKEKMKQSPSILDEKQAEFSTRKRLDEIEEKIKKMEIELEVLKAIQKN